MTRSHDKQAQLEAAIAAQETLRATLGDAVVDVTIAALRAQLAELQREGDEQDAYLATLRSYIPEVLASKIRKTGVIEGERRQVTVVFADIIGFTRIAEQLGDPEQVAALVNEALKEMAEAVYQYEGYIDKFIGDAVMAVFGAPVAHENDPERALRAVLAMRERMEDYNRRWLHRLGEPLMLHVGVNTGTVIAGNVGSDLRLSYTVLGDAVNTAARLQDAADPGQILVSRDTYRLTREAFSFRSLDPLVIKGKRAPVIVYELQQAHLVPGKGRGVDVLDDVFVGREVELIELRHVAERLCDGHGGIVTIAGEAGIGKSRLLEHLCDSLDDRAQWLIGHCFAHTSSLPYAPFLDLLRRHTGLKNEHSEAEARARLHRMLDRLFPGDVEARAVFVNLIALKPTDAERALFDHIPAQALRTRIFELIEAFLRKLASARPCLVILEDTHWIDSSSLHLLEHLLEHLRDAPLVLAFVFRKHTYGASTKLVDVLDRHRDADQVNLVLSPLPDDASLAMVHQLLRLRELPPALRVAVLDRAEGNPFFIEEIIHALIDRGALYRDDATRAWTTTSLLDTVKIPSTLQGVLMSRLDRLPPETLWLVQQASVIGRIFLYRVLLAMTDEPDRVDADLTRLEREELIREHSNEPEIEYIFRHALTQEIAYRSLLAPRRKQLHRRVANALLTMFGERIEEYYSIIGEHYLRGEAWERAADYLARAGDTARHLCAYAEAALHYNHVLSCLDRLDEQGDEPVEGARARRDSRVDITIELAKVSILASGTQHLLSLLHVAETAARDSLAEDADSLDRQTRLARVQFWIGYVHIFRNDQATAAEYFVRVLPIAEATGDEELLTLPSCLIGRIQMIKGHFGFAWRTIERAIEPLDRAANWVEWMIAVGFTGMSMVACGHCKRGLVMLQRALDRARDNGDITYRAAVHAWFAFAYRVMGDYESVRARARACLDLVRQSGDLYYDYVGHGMLAWAEARLGHVAAAQRSAEASQEAGAKLGGDLVCADWFAAAEVVLDMRARRLDQAVERAGRAIDIARSVDGIFAEAVARRAWGEALTLAGSDSWDQADDQFARSIALFHRGEDALDVALTRVAWGELHAERGAVERATAEWRQARAQFQASELPALVARVDRLLARFTA